VAEGTTLDRRVRYPLVHDAGWLRRCYVYEALTRREIVRLVGCSDVLAAAQTEAAL
jgi:hypothetical protein